MTDAAFPDHISAALNRLTVPRLPAGFADRLVARIEAGDLPVEGLSDLPPLPMPRLPVAGVRRWLKPRRVIAGAVLLGLATATAAASGAFGEPVYVPVVSEALAKADVVELPVASPAARVSKPVVQPPDKAAVTGPAAVHQLYERLRSDPEYRALPREERVAVARKELMAMLRDGTIKPGEIRQARREMREQYLAKAAARQEAVAQGKPAPKAGALPKKPVSPEIIAQRRAAIQAMSQQEKRRLFELRRALRTAPLAERPAIHREIRALLQKAQENAPPVEGNANPAR